MRLPGRRKQSPARTRGGQIPQQPLNRCNPPAEIEGGEGAGEDASLVDVSNVDLHRAAVVGGDQPVGGRAAEGGETSHVRQDRAIA